MANNMVRVLEEKLAMGGAKENIEEMGERIRKAEDKADRMSRMAEEEKGPEKTLRENAGP